MVLAIEFWQLNIMITFDENWTKTDQFQQTLDLSEWISSFMLAFIHSSIKHQLWT